MYENQLWFVIEQVIVDRRHVDAVRLQDIDHESRGRPHEVRRHSWRPAEIKRGVHLDDENARNLMTLLCQTCRNRGNTFMALTHDRDIMHTADTVFELRGGFMTTVKSHCHKGTPGS